MFVEKGFRVFCRRRFCESGLFVLFVLGSFWGCSKNATYLEQYVPDADQVSSGTKDDIIQIAYGYGLTSKLGTSVQRNLGCSNSNVIRGVPQNRIIMMKELVLRCFAVHHLMRHIWQKTIHEMGKEPED